MKSSFLLSALFLILFANLSCICLQAQELSVVKFEKDPNDLKARTNPVKDKKGKDCALLCISIPSLHDVTFGKEVVESSYYYGVYNVYLSASSKSINIFHPNYLPLEIKFKDYNLKLEEKTVYTIFLSPETNVRTFINSDNKKAVYVAFLVNPANSVVNINGERLKPRRGNVVKLLPIGNYQYQVSAIDYHDSFGDFTLAKGEDTKIFDVKLKPTFGWATFTGDDESTDAKIFIDGDFKGHIPMTTDRIKSGPHLLRIKKDMYKTYEDTLIIEDDITTHSNIKLARYFSYVNIKTQPDVEIWINDTLRSRGAWSGRLLSGDYKIEAKKAHFFPKVLNTNIPVVDTPIDIVVSNLIPKRGILNVFFDDGSSVYINDEYIGETPLSTELTEGAYKVTVRKDGYADNVGSAVVVWGEECSIYGKLIPQSMAHVRQIYEETGNEDPLSINVLNVTVLGKCSDSPMNMFDGNPYTTFQVKRNDNIIVKLDRPLRYISRTDLLMDPSGIDDAVLRSLSDTLSCSIVGLSFGGWLDEPIDYERKNWQFIDGLICSGSDSSSSEFDSVVLEIKGDNTYTSEISISELNFWGVEYHGQEPLIYNLYEGSVAESFHLFERDIINNE